ncbi:hypothetical protein H9L19_03590 [Weissella diestrammenae]|uniref:YitT family protein n=1 Tax=Weissella diestrammenae TaxID=1162633 RepID=A0A7G9T774_9LACO|nr:hypothetical protein [Weissella diestrammenae]MCM0582448.1 hypothetical protein [Weissella diestrammenae]QNN75949.1 hypothetical protein H9L19_03590 [Weissella diestrammenae]
MFLINGVKRSLKTYESISLLLIGLFLNGVGNGLAVATNSGSAAWTAASANLQNLTHVPKGVFLFAFGFAAAILVIILTQQFNFFHFVGGMIFLFFFSYLVNFASQFFTFIQPLPFIIRILIDLLSVVIVGIGISLTMRVRLITHPLDDLVIYTRFQFFKGNAFISQVINFTIPIIISLLIWQKTGELVTLNIGTLVSFFGIGTVIGWADHHIIPTLIYRETVI